MSNNTKFAGFFIYLVLSCLNTNQASAQSFFSEVRLGGSLIDVRLGKERQIYEYRRKGMNAEALTTPVNIDFLNWYTDSDSTVLNALLNPRVHFGATIALEKDTTSSAYTGLTWQLPVFERLFFEGSFGAAIHNGELKNVNVDGSPITGSDKIQLRGYGSRVLFRESLGIGAKITDKVNMIVQVSHMSHAGLAGEFNAGQTDIALKLGWQF